MCSAGPCLTHSNTVYCEACPVVRRMREEEEAVKRAKAKGDGGFGSSERPPWISAWDMWPDEHGVTYVPCLVELQDWVV